jgi:hypothetical protein
MMPTNRGKGVESSAMTGQKPLSRELMIAHRDGNICWSLEEYCWEWRAKTDKDYQED